MVMALNERELSTNMLSQHSILKVNNIRVHIFIVAIPQKKHRPTINQSMTKNIEKV